MTMTTIEAVTPNTQTPAEARRTKAQEAVERLRREQERVLARQREAAEALPHIQDEILVRERAGTDEDAKALRTLRSRRLELQSIVEDLGRILSTIEQDLSPALAELRAAERACAADQYNAIVTKQDALTAELEATWTVFADTFAKTLAEKRLLAAQQAHVHREMGLPEPTLPPQRVTDLYREEAGNALLSPNAQPTATPARKVDWSLRTMTAEGKLAV